MTSLQYMLKSIWRLVFAVVGSVLLFGCGEDGTTENVSQDYPTTSDVVATATDLSKCTSDNAGEVYLVKEEGSFYGCNGSEWKNLGSTSSTDTVFVVGADTFYVSTSDSVLVSKTDTFYVVSAADYSCETKTSAEGNYVAIYCGGDSIGVVLNGAKGDVGEKGDAGATGATGATGVQGEQGIQGEKGDTGSAGIGCSVESSTETTVTVKCGTDTFTMNLNGSAFMASSSSNASSSGSSSSYEIENATVTGIAQKGPFTRDSKISLYELENERTLAQTGRVFDGSVASNEGNFTIKNISLVSSAVKLVATGKYRNEVTGANSSAEISLKAYANLKDRQKVNVNVLTHLEYDRVNYLIGKSNGKLDLTTAKKQAQKEILASVFGVDASDFSSSEKLDVMGSDDGDAALLALSMMLQGDRDVAELTSLLTAFAQDVQTDGVWDGSVENGNVNWRDIVADWSLEKDVKDDFSGFRLNVESLGQSKSAAEFEKWIRKFYGLELGIGLCGSDVALGTVKNVSNSQSGFYASSYSSVEDKGGAVRFICADRDSLGNAYAKNESPKWRVATNIEKDTMGLKYGAETTHEQASAVKGVVNTNLVYVYEGSSYRLGTAKDIDLGLNGCTAARLDTVAKSGDSWYKCAADDVIVVNGTLVARSWRAATNIEKDTAGWSKNGPYEDGMVQKGNVTGDPYYYQKSLNQWREATLQEVYVYKNKDDIDWTVDTTDGAYKVGKNSGNYYVYDSQNGGWRDATTSMDYANGIDGCTKARAVANYKARSTKSGDHYVYNCKLVENGYSWVKETDVVINDTYGEKCLVGSGELYDGRIVNANKYVCDDGVLRAATASDIASAVCKEGDVVYLNGKKCQCSENMYTYNGKNIMVDSRDGLVYTVVTIGSQTWMAENLNYTPDVTDETYASFKGRTWCYNNDIDTCAKYGRLYTWEAAIDLAGVFSSDVVGCGYEEEDYYCSFKYPVRGICPEGWHLPSYSDWKSLRTYSANYALRSTTDWLNGKNGDDSYGFSILPAGRYAWTFKDKGKTAYFWSTSVDDDTDAFYWCFGCDGTEDLYESSDSMSYGQSVRCVKNSN